LLTKHLRLLVERVIQLNELPLAAVATTLLVLVSLIQSAVLKTLSLEETITLYQGEDPSLLVEVSKSLVQMMLYPQEIIR